MQECNRSQKIAICTVGLPARGKTYISRKLNRYFNWLGYKSRVFINGNYRREICGTDCNYNFFDPNNQQAQQARNECAKKALQDLKQFLSSGGDVGILDGTNITKDRRKWIESELKQEFQGIQTLWIESVCNDSKVIQNNISLTKLTNPDYANMDPEEATTDFLERIKMYEQKYQTITDEEQLSYIKTINVGSDLIVHQVYGFLLSKIVSFIMNLHTYPRPIYLSRHGESQYNVEDKVGGDSDLSKLGEQYATKLSDFLHEEFPTKELQNDVLFFTSTMRRALHTSEVVSNKINVKPLSLKTLDEINVGICDGMTYTEISQKFPNDFQERKINKLTYRYPRGESYLDLISRIEPIIFEIERSRQPVLIIAHQAILRCLYAYFHQNEIPEVPTLDIPLHCVIKLTPAAYFCDETRVNINPQTGEHQREEEFFEIKRLKNKQKNPDLVKWLNKEVKLHPAIIDLEKQFQNWFFFQEVLLKTGNPLKSILTNKFDDYSTQKNQKIVKKHIIKLIGIEPKVEKGQSQIEEYLKAIKIHSKPITLNPLLSVARKETQDILSELTRTLKVNDKKQIQSLQNNYEEKFISKLPKKLKNIEDQMHRFRDEKIIHEIQAVQLKQKDEQKEKEWLLQLRDNELEKIRANHQFIKEQDQKIYQFWKNTETIKHNRINSENQFNIMMTNRMLDILNNKKKEDENVMETNIQLFIQTCIRQGIELEKDPTKKSIPEKAKFSAVATMMKIKERTRKTEDARKARTKRKNKMLVEQIKQQELVESKKKLEELVDKLNYQGQITNQECHLNHINNLRQNLQVQERKEICKIMEEQKEKFFDQLRYEAKEREQDVKIQRMKEWRILQVQYMEQNYDRKIEKRTKHNQQMQPLILSILDLADKCYLTMNDNNNNDSTNPKTLHKKIWQYFIYDWQSELSQVKQLQDNVIATITQDFIQYYECIKDWRNTTQDEIMANVSLAEYLFDITDSLYPIKEIQQGINFYLPLKISLIGGKFSGRKTTAKYLNIKYGLEIIDIEAIIKESLKLAFPPPEDPKKKKDSKKPIDIPIIENPELKQYGIEINEFKDTTIPDELLLKGILIKLNQIFGQRTPQQVAIEIKEAKELQLRKQQEPPPEEIKKPHKKVSKKETQATGQSLEELIKEYINSKTHYYTKGWVMIGFPETIKQAKILEEALSGYIPYEERLNQQAEERKKKFQELLDIPNQEDEIKIFTSGTDLIINLDIPLEQRIQRMQNRRIDLNSEIIYNLEENPPPPEIKIDKLSKIDSETEEKLSKEFQFFNQNLNDVIEWCQQFGFDEEFKQYHSIKIIQKGYEVAKAIDPIINNVLTRNLEYLDQITQEYQLTQEQPQIEGDENQQNENRENLEVKQLQDNQTQQLLDTKPISTERGRSQQQSRQRDGQSEFLTQDQLKGILNQWDEISNSYIRESQVYIRRMNHQRKKCQQIFLQTQKQFLEFFESPDNKLKLLREFQTNYNKFLQENDDLSKQYNAKQQLKEHLQKTYESLWDILNYKKNQALDFVKKLKEERFIAIQIQQYMQHILMLLQIETNLLTEIQLLGKPWSEHFILEPPHAKLIDGYKFPQLDILIQYYNESLEKITQDEESLIIKIQKEIAIKRGQIIKNVAYSKMTEMLLMEDLIYSRINDWIICGIKHQNDFCFEAINYFKKQIEDRLPAILIVPEPNPISSTFKMIYLQQHLIPETSELREIIQFYEELKSLSETVWIMLDIFEQFHKRRIKILGRYGIIAEKISQLGPYPNKMFSYQTMMITIILNDCRIPTQEEIDQLLIELKNIPEEDRKEYFLDYQFWFDDNFLNFNHKIYIKHLLFNILQFQSQDLLVSIKENFQYFKQYENCLFSTVNEQSKSIQDNIQEIQDKI